MDDDLFKSILSTERARRRKAATLLQEKKEKEKKEKELTGTFLFICVGVVSAIGVILSIVCSHEEALALLALFLVITLVILKLYVDVVPPVEIEFGNKIVNEIELEPHITKESILRKDKVLYLRPFCLDDLDDFIDFVDHPALNIRALKSAFKKIGPLKEIRNPARQPIQGDGAISTGDNWKDVVSLLIRTSQCVLFNCKPTDGLAWELQKVRAHLAPNQVFMIVAGGVKLSDREWSEVRNFLSQLDYQVPKPIPGVGTLIAFDSRWNGRVAVDGNPSAEDVVQVVARQLRATKHANTTKQITNDKERQPAPTPDHVYFESTTQIGFVPDEEWTSLYPNRTTSLDYWERLAQWKGRVRNDMFSTGVRGLGLVACSVALGLAVCMPLVRKIFDGDYADSFSAGILISMGIVVTSVFAFSLLGPLFFLGYRIDKEPFDKEPLRSLLGHDDWISSVAFSSNGEKIISSSHDGTVRVRGVKKDGEVPIVSLIRAHEGGVLSAVFGATDSRIATCGKDNIIKIWNLESSEKPPRFLLGHKDEVRSISFSKDGKWIVSGGFDSTVRIWDAEKGGDAKKIFHHGNWVEAVCISSDGDRIVSCGRDGKIKVWAIEREDEPLRVLEGHVGPIWDIDFQESNEWIVSGGADGTVRVWRTNESCPFYTFQFHSTAVHSVAISADGKSVASGSVDGHIRVWDMEKGEKSLAEFRAHSDGVTCLSFSPEGRKLVSGGKDHLLKIWAL